jgi:hypothetical protein
MRYTDHLGNQHSIVNHVTTLKAAQIQTVGLGRACCIRYTDHLGNQQSIVLCSVLNTISHCTMDSVVTKPRLASCSIALCSVLNTISQLEDAIGSHVCLLEANMQSIPLGWSLSDDRLTLYIRFKHLKDGGDAV